MRGRDCEHSFQMYSLIDGLVSSYSKDNYDEDDNDTLRERISGFINECTMEIDDYNGDRTDRIKITRYFISSIVDLLYQNKKSKS